MMFDLDFFAPAHAIATLPIPTFHFDQASFVASPEVGPPDTDPPVPTR